MLSTYRHITCAEDKAYLALPEIQCEKVSITRASICGSKGLFGKIIDHILHVFE
jgi:hypothetical protein